MPGLSTTAWWPRSASRTRLIVDPDALGKVDTEIAAHVTCWGSLSVDKTQREIDYWVDRYDPAAVRRTEDSVRGRHVDVGKPDNGSGTADIEAQLLATDAEALDQRLDAMARCGLRPTTPAPWTSAAPPPWPPSATAPTAWSAPAATPTAMWPVSSPVR